jgi:hypothetical protein
MMILIGGFTARSHALAAVGESPLTGKGISSPMEFKPALSGRVDVDPVVNFAAFFVPHTCSIQGNLGTLGSEERTNSPQSGFGASLEEIIDRS